MSLLLIIHSFFLTSRPLLMAAENGHVEVAEALIKAGCDVDKAEKNGVTPLLKAAQNGHVKVAEPLIEAGCDVDKADSDGATPLSRAAQYGHAEVAEALLRTGCDTSSVRSIRAFMIGPFVAHLEEQQSKMVALAGGLHRRLGAESVVLRLDDNLLQMIWEQVERGCVVPPVEEEDEQDEQEEEVVEEDEDEHQQEEEEVNDEQD